MATQIIFVVLGNSYPRSPAHTPSAYFKKCNPAEAGLALSLIPSPLASCACISETRPFQFSCCPIERPTHPTGIGGGATAGRARRPDVQCSSSSLANSVAKAFLQPGEGKGLSAGWQADEIAIPFFPPFSSSSCLQSVAKRRFWVSLS